MARFWLDGQHLGMLMGFKFARYTFRLSKVTRDGFRDMLESVPLPFEECKTILRESKSDYSYCAFRLVNRSCVGS
jgi:hypothetical protein